MRRGTSVLVAVWVIALLLTASSAAAQTTVPTSTQSVTATGTGQAAVQPANRHSNSSIAAAYNAAEKASIPSAITAARQQALRYAQASGLTLGPLESVSDQQNSGYYGPGQGFFGPFGPGRFCGTERLPVFGRVKGQRRVVRTRKVHRCIVPRYAFTTLTVTYSAT